MQSFPLQIELEVFFILKLMELHRHPVKSRQYIANKCATARSLRMIAIPKCDGLQEPHFILISLEPSRCLKYIETNRT